MSDKSTKGIDTSPRSGKAKYILMGDELVPFADAKVHVLSNCITYALGVFEGIRGYWNDADKELYLFRLDEHLERLQQSMRAVWFDTVFPVDEVREKIMRTIRANEHRENIHLRVMAIVTGDPAVTAMGPVELVIQSGPYPSGKWQDKGMAVQVSSWQRVGDMTNPPRIKATPNYANGRFAMLQAQRDGYDSAIMLTQAGKVAETPVATVFMVRRGQIVTPGVTENILESLTRETLIQLFEEHVGRKVIERPVDRTELYSADELFACGSGWEVTPIASVDRMALNLEAPGPVTREIRKAYLDAVYGRSPDYRHWLTPVWNDAPHAAAKKKGEKVVA
jgi:branched-chain amino acid aminotransferase